jgi:glycosyltransferase involved in cell wall biosynthesis
VRIAQVAPLYESVPPHGYGGTERVVSYLTEELVSMGHDVTLFASGDSVTQAELIAPCPRALRLDKECVDQNVHHVVLLDQVFRQASRFDVVHFHIDYLHFPLSLRLRPPRLTTLHGRLDLPDLRELYRVFAQEPLVSISDSQRRPLAGVNWLGTVHHGLPPDLFRCQERRGKYLAFLGRVSPEKGLDQAIAIAQRVGVDLKIAAKVDPKDQCYHDEVIKPLLRAAGSRAEFVGEVGGIAKEAFLGNALALLFPIDWPEPFGLVMIEAMACGTPVIAYPRGSVLEVMEDGVTGFVVNGIDEAVEAVARVDRLDRRGCRQVFEQRFTARRMASDYLALYEGIADGRPRRKPPGRPAASWTMVDGEEAPAALPAIARSTGDTPA